MPEFRLVTEKQNLQTFQNFLNFRVQVLFLIFEIFQKKKIMQWLQHDHYLLLPNFFSNFRHFSVERLWSKFRKMPDPPSLYTHLDLSFTKHY